MRAEPKPRTRTRDKHTARAVVARGYVTLADVRAEISQRRRGDVYRTDVEFAERRDAPRVRGGAVAKLERVRELRERGWSHLAIACELEMGQVTVARLCQRHGIVKGRGKEKSENYG